MSQMTPCDPESPKAAKPSGMNGETSTSLVAVLEVPVAKTDTKIQDERTQHLIHGDPQPLNLEVLHERLADRVGRIINEIGTRLDCVVVIGIFTSHFGNHHCFRMGGFETESL